MPTFNGNLNALDLITNQGNDMLTGLIEDVPVYAPEFAQIPVTVKDGITYKIVKRLALPQAGWRQINQGIGTVKSTYKQEVKEMFPLDCIINVDELIVQGDDESAGGDILTKEAQGALQSAILTIGAQTWYGTSNDANGFQGVRAQLTNNVGAGGSTNTTSAYLIWLHPWGCNYPIGRKGQISMKPWNIQQIVTVNPGTSGASNIMAYVSNISSFIGFTVGSNYSCYAVTGLSGPGANTYMLTDKLMGQLLSYVPMTRRQGLVWFMNRNAHWQLQQSRMTIYNANLYGTVAGYSYQAAGASGAPAVAPPPDSALGYPIVVTDSISNTESN
jgi:hypothetical protein